MKESMELQCREKNMRRGREVVFLKPLMRNVIFSLRRALCILWLQNA